MDQFQSFFSLFSLFKAVYLYKDARLVTRSARLVTRLARLAVADYSMIANV